MSPSETFVGYAGLQPFVLDDASTYLKPLTFEPRPLESDEVEIEVSACGM